MKLPIYGRMWTLLIIFLCAFQLVNAASRDSMASSIIWQITHMIEKATKGSLCGICKDALAIGKSAAPIASGEVLAKVIDGLCSKPRFMNSKACQLPHDKRMAESVDKRSTLYNDAANVLTLMDPHSMDGELFCHFFFMGACPMPQPTDVDLSDWWPPKPKDAHDPPPSGSRFNVLHLSDIHFQKGYKVGSEAECGDFMCCRDIAIVQKNHKPSMPAPVMGHYKCDTPETLVRSSLEDITDGRFSYDFAIFTGDMVDHDPVLISYQKSIEEEEETMKYFKDYLGGVPVYAVLGNHDTYPFSQVAQDSSGFSNLFNWNVDLMSHLWEEYGWLDGESAQQVKEHYGGFAVTAKQGLRIITVNSNFWYKWNMYNYWNTMDPDTSGVLKFLANELLDCERQGHRAWIIAHVPPNGADTLPVPSLAFTQIVERFSPHVIAGLFFGHTHQDEFQLVYQSPSKSGRLLEQDKTSENVLNTAWIAQSITPLTNFNPGWRYYEVDSKTFSIMESHNFYSKLNDSFPENLNYLDWDLLYSARKAYNEDGWWPDDAPLNGSFWHEIAQRIKNDVDFAQVYLNNGYRHSPYAPTCDDSSCMDKTYCYVSSFNSIQAAMCADAH